MPEIPHNFEGDEASPKAKPSDAGSHGQPDDGDLSLLMGLDQPAERQTQETLIPESKAEPQAIPNAERTPVKQGIDAREAANEVSNHPLSTGIALSKQQVLEEDPNATPEEVGERVAEQIDEQHDEALQNAQSFHTQRIVRLLEDARPDLSDEERDELSQGISERLTPEELSNFYVLVHKNEHEPDANRRDEGKRYILGQMAAVLGPEADELSDDLYRHIAADPELLKELKTLRNAALLARHDIEKAEKYARLVDSDDKEGMVEFFASIQDEKLRGQLQQNQQLVDISNERIAVLEKEERFERCFDFEHPIHGIEELDREQVVTLGRFLRQAEPEVQEIVARGVTREHDGFSFEFGDQTTQVPNGYNTANPIMVGEFSATSPSLNALKTAHSINRISVRNAALTTGYTRFLLYDFVGLLLSSDSFDDEAPLKKIDVVIERVVTTASHHGLIDDFQQTLVDIPIFKNRVKQARVANWFVRQLTAISGPEWVNFKPEYLEYLKVAVADRPNSSALLPIYSLSELARLAAKQRVQTLTGNFHSLLSNVVSTQPPPHR